MNPTADLSPQNRAGGRARRPRRLLAVASLPLVVLLASLVPMSSASAAAGSAFDPNVPQVFASKSANQADPTGLFSVRAQANGTYAYAPIGPDSNLVYNALTYNTDDNYLYAISGDPRSTSVPYGSLLKIGATGGYDVIGSGIFRQGQLQTNMGAYNPDEKVFYVLSAQGTTMYRIDLDPSSATYGQLINTVTVSPLANDGVIAGSDFTYANGALWSLGRDGLYRIALNGTSTQFPVPAGAASSIGGNDQAGAAWTYFGGDLGFSYNGSGEVIRIAVTNPTSATPTFRTVVKSGGSASGQNDGAASVGSVDLAVTKTGRFVSGGSKVEYTIDVVNNGPADSTGWTVTDTIPNGFNNITVAGAGTATVSGQTVTVVGGPLVAKAKATFTVTVTATSSRPDRFTNTAVVAGSDVDTVASNNQSSAVLEYPNDAAPGDDGDVADDELAAPDTGAQPSPMWPWAISLAAGLALLAALGTRMVVTARSRR